MRTPPTFSVSYHPQPSERTHRYGVVIPAIGRPKEWKATLLSLAQIDEPELIVALTSPRSVPELRSLQREVLVLEAQTRRRLLSRGPLIDREGLIRAAFDFLVQHHFCQYLLVLRPGVLADSNLLTDLKQKQREGEWAALPGALGWLASSYDYEERLRVGVEPGWWATLPS